jgi:hypothetical protein
MHDVDQPREQPVAFAYPRKPRSHNELKWWVHHSIAMVRALANKQRRRLGASSATDAIRFQPFLRAPRRGQPLKRIWRRLYLAACKNMRDWNSRTRSREARLERSAALAKGKVIAAEDIGVLFETIL